VDFESLSVEQVPMEMEDMSWVVVHSGVRRELSSSAFSDRVRECREGLEAVQVQAPEVRGMRGVGRHHLDAIQDPWVRRLRHLVTENERVLQASESIAKGDASKLGSLLLETHESLRSDYEVSCRELDVLVELAAAHPNCWGARMVGGGFGGCTLNLVHSAHVDSFSRNIQEEYLEQTQRQARVFSFDLVGGARVD
jgi:galactokinase